MTLSNLNYFKIASSIVILVLLVGCPKKGSVIDSSLISNPKFSKISILGSTHKSGYFDVSIEYDTDGNGWMAYSRVELPKFVETHLAQSNNRGKTWEYISTVNKSYSGTYISNRKKYSGVWRNETPSLLQDVKDVSSRRWKLFSHHYPAKSPYRKGSHLYDLGWIEYKYASNPSGPWSKPIRLFGKSETNSLLDLSKLHPNLKEFRWFNEIGSIVISGTIYLSLDATTTETGLGEWHKRKIILVSSNDHGKSWRYNGVLTDHKDAVNFGYLILTGSSLVKKSKHLYLLVTPSGAKGLFKKNRGHDGVFVIEIEDIRSAKLKRDKKGNLIVLKWIKPSLQSGGLSDYDENNTNGGIVFSQINTTVRSSDADFFQIFNTTEHIMP